MTARAQIMTGDDWPGMTRELRPLLPYSGRRHERIYTNALILLVLVKIVLCGQFLVPCCRVQIMTGEDWSGFDCFTCALTVLYALLLSYMRYDCLICALTILYARADHDGGRLVGHDQ